MAKSPCPRPGLGHASMEARPRPGNLVPTGMRTAVLMCLAVSLASCGNSERACRAKAEALGAVLREADTRRGIETRHVKLVLRTDLPLVPDAWGSVIELGSEGAWTPWRDVGASPFAAVLDLERAARERLPGHADEPFQLAIDAATPWKMVVEALDAIGAAGAQRVEIVFARPPAERSPPPRTALDDELDAILRAAPSERATMFAARIRDVVEGCDAVKRLFGSVASSDRASKEELFITGLPPALIACDCACDVPALTSAMWRLMSNEHPTTTLTLALGGEHEILALPGSTTWREASTKLGRGTRGLRARVAD